MEQGLYYEVNNNNNMSKGLGIVLRALQDMNEAAKKPGGGVTAFLADTDKNGVPDMVEKIAQVNSTSADSLNRYNETRSSLNKDSNKDTFETPQKKSMPPPLTASGEGDVGLRKFKFIAVIMIISAVVYYIGRTG